MACHSRRQSFCGFSGISFSSDFHCHPNSRILHHLLYNAPLGAPNSPDYACTDLAMEFVVEKLAEESACDSLAIDIS